MGAARTFAPTEGACAQSTPARHAVVVLNPAAGRGTGARRREDLEALLAAEAATRRCPFAWRILETRAPGDAARLARAAAADGADLLVAAGGDGTLSEVVNGIAGSGVRLGIVPLGTGNDFARELGVHASLGRSVHTLIHGVPRRVDLGRAGDRWFINVAGCGFDAAVAARVNRGFRRLRGTTAYLAAVCLELCRLRPTGIAVAVDDRTIEMRGLLCAMANSPSYGGGMRIAPDARIDDGLLDVFLLAEAGRLEFLRAFPRVFRGAHVNHPKVTLLRARRVAVETASPLPVLIDGEVWGTTPMQCHVVPGAIEVMAPASADRTGPR